LSHFVILADAAGNFGATQIFKSVFTSDFEGTGTAGDALYASIVKRAASAMSTPFGDAMRDIIRGKDNSGVRSRELIYINENSAMTQDRFEQDIIDGLYKPVLRPGDLINMRGDDFSTDYSAFGSNAFAASFESLGIDTSLPLGDGGWGELSASNSILDDYTFGSGADQYTLTQTNTQVSLPSFGGYDPRKHFGDTSLDSNYRPGAWFYEGIASMSNARNHISPITLDLEGDGFKLSGAYDRNIYFDIDDDGIAERVGWTEDAQVAIDNNSNGVIDNITELMGNDKEPAFRKFARYDTNGDGKIGAGDTDYDNGKLRKVVANDNNLNQLKLAV
jgi:hypothetical protein